MLHYSYCFQLKIYGHLVLEIVLLCSKFDSFFQLGLKFSMVIRFYLISFVVYVSFQFRTFYTYFITLLVLIFYECLLSNRNFHHISIFLYRFSFANRKRSNGLCNSSMMGVHHFILVCLRIKME